MGTYRPPVMPAPPPLKRVRVFVEESARLKTTEERLAYLEHHVKWLRFWVGVFLFLFIMHVVILGFLLPLLFNLPRG